MKHRFSALLFCLILMSPVVFAQKTGTYVPGQIIVRYENASQQALKGISGQDAARSFLQVMGASVARPALDPSLEIGVRNSQAVQKAATDSRIHTHLEAFSRTFVYDYIGDMDPVLMAAKLSALPGVEWAEPRYMDEIHAMPSDMYFGEIGHDYFFAQGFYGAWDVSKSSSDIIIAVVDSGVDYTHPELVNKAWVNKGEIPSQYHAEMDINFDSKISSAELLQWIRRNNQDYNGDGKIDLRDALHASSPLTTGTDSDGNGVPDDILGYDFWESGYTNATVTRDNDPYGEHSLHGTHVAGLAAAETNNGAGIAGTGWNARYMAVKVGGVADNPATPDVNESRSIGFGYPGILYAAINGAQIINCSFGGSNYSQLNHEYVMLATAMGSLIVGSAGNDNSAVSNYPGSFPEVLSVASTNYDGVPIGSRSDFSSYGYTVDVMATGQRSDTASPKGVLSTWRSSAGHGYAYSTGTSMSAPITAGLAALLVDLRRDWSPERLKMQIRVTSTQTDGLNHERYANMLGRGYINAEKALGRPMPGYTVVSASVLNANGEKATTGEPAFAVYTVVNHGEGESATAKLENLTSGITITSSTQSVSASTGDTLEVRFPVELGGFKNDPPLLKIEFYNDAIDYYDFHIFPYSDIFLDEASSPSFESVATSYGTIGAIDPINGIGVSGFTINRQSAPRMNVLFEAGVMVATKRDRIADRIRHVDTEVGRGIVPLSPYVTQTGNTGHSFGQYGKGEAALHARTSTIATDIDSTLHMTMEHFTFTIDDTHQALILKYTIRNDSQTEVADSTIVGLFADFDIGDGGSNTVQFSEADSILYVFDNAMGASTPYVGIATYGTTMTAFAMDNAATGTGLNFGLYDGFTAREKIRALKAGRAVTTVAQKDVSSLVATGPYDILPGQEIVTAFVIAYGNSLQQLKDQIARARSRHIFDVTRPGIITSDQEEAPEIPLTTQLNGNFPNPFNPVTQIGFELAKPGDMTLSIHNVLGQQVAVVHSGFHLAGRHTVAWDASRLGSGVYFVRMQTAEGILTHKMTLLK